METIKEGSELHEFQKEGWWVGIKMVCWSCNFTGKTTWDDRKIPSFRAYWKYTRHGRSGYGVVDGLTCPTCKNLLKGVIDKEEFHQRIDWAEQQRELPPKEFIKCNSSI